ncbi:tetratricopeptide repeat protein [Candidatus Altiarchaeota archaeon]
MKNRIIDFIVFFLLISIILFLWYVPDIFFYIDNNIVYEGKKYTIGQAYTGFTQLRWDNKIEAGKDILGNYTHVSDKDINRAEEYYLHLLDTIPADQKRHILSKQKEDIYLMLIEINKLKNNTNRTIKFYKELIDFEPLNIYNQIAFTQYLIDQKIYDSALDRIEIILQIDPTNIYAISKKIKVLEILGKHDIAREVDRQFSENEFSYYSTMEFFYANNQVPFSSNTRSAKKIIIDNREHTYSFMVTPEDVVKNITKIRIDPLMGNVQSFGEKGIYFTIKSITARDIDNNLILNISRIGIVNQHNVEAHGNNTFQAFGHDPYFRVKTPRDFIILNRTSIELNMIYHTTSFNNLS